MSRITLLALFLAPVFGQSFEVASIRPTTFPDSEDYFRGFTERGTCGKRRIAIEGHRVTVERVTLCGLILTAYDVGLHQVIGVPAAMAQANRANFFDIRAQAAEGTALTPEQTRTMLQALLAERFGLRLHRETRELPVYELVIAKEGHKLSAERPAYCGDGPMPKLQQSGRGFGNCNPVQTMAQLAETLSREADRPVLDRTEISGSFAFFLQWTPDGAQPLPNAAPGLFTAIQEQLGLKLEPVRASVEVLIIDEALRPSEN